MNPEKLQLQDVPEAIEVGKLCFPQFFDVFEPIVREALGNDFSHSYVTKDGGKIVGGYFLGQAQLPSEVKGAEAYAGKRGIEGVALFVLPEYRGKGIGHTLRDIPLHSGLDYIWGQHYDELNNLAPWKAFGRKHMDTIDGVHITLMDLKASPKTAAAVTPSVMKKIEAIWKELREEEPAGQCYTMSEILNRQFGFEQAWGFYVKNPKTGHAGHGDHAWNVLKDGTILDATHDQFGKPNIAVIQKSDPEYAKYHPFCPNGDEDCPHCGCETCNPDWGKTAGVEVYEKTAAPGIELMADLGWSDLGDKDLEQNTVIIFATVMGKVIGEAEYIIKGDRLFQNKMAIQGHYEGLESQMATYAEGQSGMKIAVLPKKADLAGDGPISFFEPVENEHSVQPLRAGEIMTASAPQFPTFPQMVRQRGSVTNLVSYLNGDEMIDGEDEEGNYRRNTFLRNAATAIAARRETVVTSLAAIVFPLTIYRALNLMDMDELNIKELGNSWSTQELSHIEFSSSPNTWVRTQITEAQMDWKGTFWARMCLAVGDEEDEIFIKTGTPITSLEYKTDEEPEWKPFDSAGVPITASDKTPPFSDTRYPNMDSNDGEGSNAYALMPERVEGMNNEPGINTLLGGHPKDLPQHQAPSLKAATKKSYGVVMVDMPKGITDAFEIDEEDLAGDGREEECHITVKFGLL